MTHPFDVMSVLMVRTPTGMIVRGGPGVVAANLGPHHLVVDDPSCSASSDALRAILDEISRDGLTALAGLTFAGLFAFATGDEVIVGAVSESAYATHFTSYVDDEVIVFGYVDAERAGDEWVVAPVGCTLRWRRGPQAWSPTARSVARVAMSHSSSS